MRWQNLCRKSRCGQEVSRGTETNRRHQRRLVLVGGVEQNRGLPKGAARGRWVVVDPVVDTGCRRVQSKEAAAVVEYSVIPITVLFCLPESVASCSFTAYLLRDYEYLPGLVLQFQRLCPDRTLLMILQCMRPRGHGAGFRSSPEQHRAYQLPKPPTTATSCGRVCIGRTLLLS